MKKSPPVIIDNNSAIALYTISPALTAEGDEDNSTALSYIANAIANGTAEFTAWSFSETPEHLIVDNDTTDATEVFFSLELPNITPFNDEKDFTPIITEALANGTGSLIKGAFYEDSVKLKRVDIQIA